MQCAVSPPVAGACHPDCSLLEADLGVNAEIGDLDQRDRLAILRRLRSGLALPARQRPLRDQLAPPKP